MNYKPLNNNLVSNTRPQPQNPYDNSKTISMKHQNPSPSKVKMNSSITAKFLPNQKNPVEQE